MAAKSEANGLWQIAQHSINPKANQFWTSYTTNTTNTTVLSQQLLQDTLDAMNDMRKQINRQVYYGDNIGPAPVDYGDHIIRKGIRDLSGADYSKLLPYT